MSLLALILQLLGLLWQLIQVLLKIRKEVEA